MRNIKKNNKVIFRLPFGFFKSLNVLCRKHKMVFDIMKILDMKGQYDSVHWFDVPTFLRSY